TTCIDARGGLHGNAWLASFIGERHVDGYSGIAEVYLAIGLLAGIENPHDLLFVVQDENGLRSSCVLFHSQLVRHEIDFAVDGSPILNAGYIRGKALHLSRSCRFGLAGSKRTQSRKPQYQAQRSNSSGFHFDLLQLASMVLRSRMI